MTTGPDWQHGGALTDFFGIPIIVDDRMPANAIALGDIDGALRGEEGWRDRVGTCPNAAPLFYRDMTPGAIVRELVDRANAAPPVTQVHVRDDLL